AVRWCGWGGRGVMEGEMHYGGGVARAGSWTSRASRLDTARSEFAQAVLAAFARKPRSLPCRFFYDARGSALFEEITQLEEYYPTRVETALLEAYGAEIAERMGHARVLVEFGSGSSRKTSL